MNEVNLNEFSFLIEAQIELIENELIENEYTLIHHFLILK